MQITPLPIGFGAEVSGLDLVAGWSAAEAERLRAAYDTHHLLVLRNIGTLAPETQVKFVGLFGPVGANRNAQGQPWSVLDNAEPAGMQELEFHSDISFVRYPIEGLSLHPLALPDEPTSTTFVSNAKAWDRLDPALQGELADLTADHVYGEAAEMNFDWPVLAYPHPVRMHHKRTGRPFLFVSAHHVSKINGLSGARNAEVLPILFDALYAPQARYEHFWCLGDLLIWDNLALQHARTKVADPSAGKRILQRVAIGTHNFMDQLEDVRRQAAPVH